MQPRSDTLKNPGVGPPVTKTKAQACFFRLDAGTDVLSHWP